MSLLTWCWCLSTSIYSGPQISIAYSVTSSQLNLNLPPPDVKAAHKKNFDTYNLLANEISAAEAGTYNPITQVMGRT